MQSEEVIDPESLLRWIRTHEDTIYVRNKGADGWGTVALGDLSPGDWARHVWRWVSEGQVPCRIVPDEEMPNKEDPE